MAHEIYTQIEDFLDNTLAEPDRLAFEAALQNDPELARALATVQEARARLIRQWADEPSETALLETLRQAGKEHFQPSVSPGVASSPARTFLLPRTWWAAAAAISILAVAVWFFLRPPLHERLYAEYQRIPEASFTARSGEPPNKSLQEAAEAFNKGDYATALPILNAYLPGHAWDVEARFFAGICYMEMGQYDSARAAFLPITKTRTDNAWTSEAYWYMALTYLRENRRVECISALGGIREHSDRYKDALSLWEKIR